MKYARLLKLTVFSYENENKGHILDAFLKFFPFTLEENKIVLSRIQASGFNEKKIEIFEATLSKNNLINQFLRNLLNNLDESQQRTILKQAESRLDQNLDFFIRFDKDAWIKNRKLELTDSGKCFHLKMSIAAFPKKREVALDLIRKLIMPRSQ